VLVLYDSSRGFSNLLGTPTHHKLELGFDHLVAGSQFVAVPLQHWLGQGRAVLPWEYPLFAVYMSHFFVALVIAALLWRFSPLQFRRYRARILALLGVGFLTYVFYPVAPPWMVAHAQGVPIHRVVTQVWSSVGLAVADPLVQRGDTFYNQVAAVPSIHAALTLLILMFFWRSARGWVRAVMVGYVLAMAFVLVDGGEHYLFDIVAGWLYAVAVVCAFALAGVIARRRAERLGSPRGAPASAPRLAPAGLGSVLAPVREAEAGVVLSAASPVLETDGEC
jgi:membrane-associated phospholipid phosphatase